MMSKGDRLTGKVALITGAGSGIGREAALQFAQQGASIAVVDIALQAAEDTAAAIQQAGGRAVAVEADVSKADHCARMVEAAEHAFGTLNVLFNNAGIMDSGDDDAVSTTEEVWN